MDKVQMLEKMRKRMHIVATVEGEGVVESVQQAGVLGADLVELRLDRMKRVEKDPQVAVNLLKAVRERTALPLILTIRSPQEQEPSGELTRWPDERRLELYEQLIPHIDMVDIETHSSAINERVIQQVQQAEKLVILSYHDYERTPGEEVLLEQANHARNLGADIIKIAALANTLEDVKTLLMFCQSWTQSPIVAISLGTVGSISRIVGFVFGSCLTYGYIQKPVGPGQMSVKLLVESRRLYYGD